MNSFLLITARIPEEKEVQKLLQLLERGHEKRPEPQSTVVSGQFLFTMRCLFVAVLISFVLVVYAIGY